MELFIIGTLFDGTFAALPSNTGVGTNRREGGGSGHKLVIQHA
jgi:hypothetical protein